jgi:adenosylmethionine-8-amino-7-oxononanoate aminotransferase
MRLAARPAEELAADIAAAHKPDEPNLTQRLHIIGRTNGYHGTMAFGTSIGGMEAVRNGWGPLVPMTSQVQHDSAQALRDELERVGPERVAAFFCEPVMGAGGVYPPAPGYIEEVAEICRRAACSSSSTP